MRIHPMVSVKKAAAVLGMDKDTIREKLASGEMRGERRKVGSKDKWLIYSGEIEDWLDRKLNEPDHDERVSLDGMVALFENTVERSPITMEGSIQSGSICEPQMEAQPGDAKQLEEHFEDKIGQKRTGGIVVAYNRTIPSTSLVPINMVDHLIQTVTREFASILSEEKQRSLQLQLKLDCFERELAQAREREHAAEITSATKTTEVSELRSRLKALETDLEAARLPWWRRLFA